MTTETDETDRAIPVPADLADDVVRIRPFEDSDVERTVAAANDPETVRWTRVPQPYTADTAREWFASHADERAAGTGAAFAAADVQSDELLGSFGFVEIDQENAVVELGYWVCPAARGGGVASRATRLLAEWALRELGFARVELLIAPENLASIRVAENAGFTHEGVLRSYREHPREDGRADFAMFSLLPTDLP